ncbi:MAG: hypothetical protein HY513_04885 [Candidatus Aenigmarchaeota archaeon]|nr:hypothetical protein [Candidatus Aenigmarchaeota archaeon]
MSFLSKAWTASKAYVKDITLELSADFRHEFSPAWTSYKNGLNEGLQDAGFYKEKHKMSATSELLQLSYNALLPKTQEAQKCPVEGGQAQSKPPRHPAGASVSIQPGYLPLKAPGFDRLRWARNLIGSVAYSIKSRSLSPDGGHDEKKHEPEKIFDVPWKEGDCLVQPNCVREPAPPKKAKAESRNNGYSKEFYAYVFGDGEPPEDPSFFGSNGMPHQSYEGMPASNIEGVPVGKIKAFLEELRKVNEEYGDSLESSSFKLEALNLLQLPLTQQELMEAALSRRRRP